MKHISTFENFISNLKNRSKLSQLFAAKTGLYFKLIMRNNDETSFF